MTARQSVMNQIKTNSQKMIPRKRGKEEMMWCPADNVTRRILA
jgi:hypothetical protein